MQAQITFTQVAPGVWKGIAGNPETYDLLKAAGSSPNRTALAKMSAANFPFNEKDIVAKVQDGKTALRFPLNEDEQLYGFGLNFQTVHQRGKILQLHVDHYGGKDNGRTHAPVPFYISSKGYGVFINSARYITVYAGCGVRKDSEHPPVEKDRNTDKTWSSRPYSDAVEMLVPAAGTEIYVFAGPTALDAVRRFNLFNGGGVLPPRWGLGFTQRVRSLFTADEVKKEANDFLEKGYPLDFIGLEPGWQSKSYPGTFEWDRSRFPEPGKFVQEMLEKNIRLNLWINPYVSKQASIYKSITPYTASHTVWVGEVPDFMIPEARKIFFGQLQKDQVDIGVSGYKIDEVDGYDYYLWPDVASFPSGLSAEQMRQTYGVLAMRYSAELFHQKNQRTYGLVRASNAGAVSFPYVIYNDYYNHEDFITALINSGYSGLLWTPEARASKTAEEWLRRFQTVIFSPMAMINAWASGTKPWSYPEVAEQIKELALLRMQMMPYWYTEFAKYHFEGTPVFRGMSLEADFRQYPEKVAGSNSLEDNPYKEATTREIKDQYMAGEFLLIAPLFTGQTSRKVVLPKGKWYDFYTGDYVGNGEVLTISPGLDKIPVYVKDGAIIPMMPPTLHAPKAHEKVDIEIRHYGEKPATYLLYDDDGETFNYEKGAFSWRKIKVEKDKNNQWKGTISSPEANKPNTIGKVSWKFMSASADSLRSEAAKVLKQQILKDAAWALKQKPETVTAKTSPRSAGGKHDFYSEGDYWWPNPASAVSPYIQRDGMTNPDNFVAHRHAMIRLSRVVGALASAYIISKDAKYVRHALTHCKAWFMDTATMMNPHLLFAQAIKGRATGRGIGIIDAIQLMEVVKGVEAMQDVMDAAVYTGVKKWFADFTKWLTTHRYGIDEMNAANNHGTCWVMQVAVFAKFTGNDTLVKFCSDRYKNVLLPNQMATDGSFPQELRRTKPYGYSIFNLDAMATICQVLSSGADNLWQYQTPDGRSIKNGIEYLYPYIADKTKWPHKQDVMYWENWPVAQPFLIFGANAYKNKNWFHTWQQLDHAPQVDEVIRNLPVRNPLIWLENAPRNMLVSSLAALQRAIDNAKPGDKIQLAKGVYTTTEDIVIKNAGTKSQPIVISAQTPGEVEITGSGGFNLVSPAAYVVISGFNFTHVASKTRLSSGTSFCRFTNNIFETPGTGDYLTIAGSDHEVDYNTFQNKDSLGKFIAIKGTGSQIAERLWIHHNYFKKQKSMGGRNGAEAFQFGLSGYSLSSSNSIVEYNLFEDCDGENELISVKASRVTLRYNTIRNCPAQFTLRHGNFNHIYGNYFTNTPGLRIFGDDHLIYSNHFENCSIGINIGNGGAEVADGAPLTSHDRPDRDTIVLNTLINNKANITQTARDKGLGSIDITIANNIVQGGGPAASIVGPAVNHKWGGNIIFNTNGAGDMPAGSYKNTDPKLVKTTREYRLRDGTVIKPVKIVILTPSDVGAAYAKASAPKLK